MKKFIFKVSFFIILLIILYTLPFQYIKNDLSKRISNSETLIIGDSHTEYIDLPNTFNYSVPGSAYFTQYSFIKEFENSIKNKKVFLAFNYHNLSNLYQNRLLNDSILPKWKEHNLKLVNKYNLYNKYRFENINENINPFKLIDFKKNIDDFASLCLFNKNESINSSTSVADTIQIKDAIFRHWLNPKYVVQDKIQRDYLNRMIMLLLKNGNEVVLLKMPITRYYFNNIPSETKKELDSFSYTNGLRLLDLHARLKLQNNYNLFKDYGHLNIKGDSIVVNYFLENELSSH